MNRPLVQGMGGKPTAWEAETSSQGEGWPRLTFQALALALDTFKFSEALVAASTAVEA